MLTLTMAMRPIPAIDPDRDTRDDSIAVVDASGSVLARHSLYELLRAGPFPFAFADVTPQLEALADERKVRGKKQRSRDYVDLLHANSIEHFDQPHLVGSHPLYRPDALLVTIRHQDTIAIVSIEAGELLWAWGRDEISGPHEAKWLASGNVLLFDNGLGRNWSRVLEVDPRTDRIVWEYRDAEPERFYSASRGSAQRLDNGNTLVSNSGAGQAFEITRDGRVVWEFWNPTRDPWGRRATIGRMQRLDAAFVERLLRRGADPGAPPPAGRERAS